MAIYNYKCPICGKTEEKLIRWDQLPPICDCHDVEIEMVKVLSVPSPAQWNCARGSL
jgi:putative FmdB family regulatory protein